MLLPASALFAGKLRLEAKLHPPGEFRGDLVEVFCGLKQSGRLIAEWRWTVEPTDGDGPYSFDSTLEQSVLSRATNPAGPADLFICLNRDTLCSFHPSVGDYYHAQQISLQEQQISLEVGPQWSRRTISDPRDLITVHYHRHDGNYESVGLWTWGEAPCITPQKQELFEVGRDAYGSVFQLDLANYGCREGRIGLLPRLEGAWERKDGPDRWWTATRGRDVYLLPGDAKIYATMPDVRPKLVAAVLTSDLGISARFSHELPVGDLPVERFALFTEDGLELKIAGTEPESPRDGRSRDFAVHPAASLDITSHTYRLRIEGYGEATIQTGALFSDPARFYEESVVLGASCTDQRLELRLFAPTAREVVAIIADAPTGRADLVEHPMQRGEKGIWRLDLDGKYAGKFYAYRLAGPSGPSGEFADPAAVCGSGQGGRPMLVDLKETNPPGFDPTRHPRLSAPTDAIIYEMSVRDFTTCANSGVKHRGLYLGLTESGTSLEGDPSIATGLNHLVELGVTHVQLMPIQDFENDETDRAAYNWGYMPVLFSTPDGWFATQPSGPARIRELKQAIQALHDRGIGVTLDVVYNHTSGASPFEKILPGYYHRLTPDGAPSNGSGCGNEFNSENPMARKLMIDSLLHWVREYGIDGFRFDLMGLHAPETMIAVREALRRQHPEVLIYGEPWTGGATPLPQAFDKGQSRGTGIAAFNDHFRDAIKGDRDGGGPGFIQVGDRLDGIRSGIPGAIDDWALNPSDAIQYCEAHDNLTTWDKLTQSAGDQPEDIRERMQCFAGLIVLTSQGIPFLHSGQEFCRSKGGNHNSYDAPDQVNQLDWSLKKQHFKVFIYYRGLIAIRKSHPIFRLRTADEVRPRLAFLEGVSHPRCIAYTLDGRGVQGESFSSVLVLLNGDSGEQSFALPEGEWTVYVDADRADPSSLGLTRNRATLPPHSGMVLAQPGKAGPGPSGG